jgi:hypothetical protein
MFAQDLTGEQCEWIWHGRNLFMLGLSGRQAERIRAAMSAILEGAPPGSMPVNIEGDPAHVGVWEVLAEQLNEPAEGTTVDLATWVAQGGRAFATDPATDAAHAQLSEWEDLPDSAGVITPMHMLVRAHVLAQIGTSNQLALLVQAAHDLRVEVASELSELRSTLARHGGFE